MICRGDGTVDIADLKSAARWGVWVRIPPAAPNNNIMQHPTYEDFQTAILASKSMSSAASLLRMHFNTFKKYAVLYGLYKPNKPGKGIHKRSPFDIPLEQILNGQHPQYQTYKLKKKLLKSGLKKNECEICGISDWCGKTLNCELDHIDGIRTNHNLSNLRILCPNCHSQTATFRSKNIKKF